MRSKKNIIKTQFHNIFRQVSGYTIIELIVVITVIGILATMVVVSYGSWRQSVTVAQLKNDLNNVKSAMESARNSGTGYITDLNSLTNVSKSDSRETLAGGSTDNGITFCVTAQLLGISYHIDNTHEPQVGACIGASQASVATLAGSGVGFFADGPGASAQFFSPFGVAVDSAGNVYVGDTMNNRIRKVTSAGVVTTLAGSGVAGFADASVTNAQFHSPWGVAVDSAGDIYVADLANNRIRKIH